MTEPFGEALRTPAGNALDICVHCGFCLPACPTYRLWGKEAESPRGRIHLIRLMAASEASVAEVVPHLDACLGCLACETACPSGVPYGELLEEARAEVESRHRRWIGDRALRSGVFALFPFPGRLRVAATAALVARRLGLPALARRSGLADRVPLVGVLDNLMPEMSLRSLWRARPGPARSGPASRTRPARLRAGTGTRPARPGPASRTRPARLRAGMLTGCVQQVLLRHVNDATERVLTAEGCEVVAPAAQGCCGALMLHTGRHDRALEAARALIDAFEDAGPLDAIVVNSAGCGSAMKDYARLLSNDPRYASRAVAFSGKVRDVSELLDGLSADRRAPLHPLEGQVAYHDACHLAHAQKIRSEPRRLLRSVPGLEVLEVPGGETCCGSAGIYNLLQPAAADELGAEKAAAVRSSGAPFVAAGNPGCALQLRRHLGPSVRVLHPVELLDASIRGIRLDEIPPW